MPRAGLTYTAVREAAERLTAQGLAPTLMRVRNEVGGTGSLTTIARHLKNWRMQDRSLHGEEMPASVQTSGAVPVQVAEVARSAWQQLADLAAREVALAKAECEAEKEEMVGQLEVEREQLVDEDARRATEAYNAVEVARAQREEAVAQRQRSEVERQAQAEQWRTDHAAAQAELATLRIQAAQATRENEALAGTLQQREETLTSTHSALEEQRALARQQEANWREQTARAQRRAQSEIENAVEKMTAALKVEAEERTTLRQRCALLVREVDQFRAREAAAHAQIATVQSQLAAAERGAAQASKELEANREVLAELLSSQRTLQESWQSERAADDSARRDVAALTRFLEQWLGNKEDSSMPAPFAKLAERLHAIERRLPQ